MRGADFFGGIDHFDNRPDDAARDRRQHVFSETARRFRFVFG